MELFLAVSIACLSGPGNLAGAPGPGPSSLFDGAWMLCPKCRPTLFISRGSGLWTICRPLCSGDATLISVRIRLFSPTRLPPRALVLNRHRDSALQPTTVRCFLCSWLGFAWGNRHRPCGNGKEPPQMTGRKT